MKTESTQKPTRLAWILWGSAGGLAVCGLGWATYTLTGQVRANLAWKNVTEAIESRDYEKAEKNLPIVKQVWNESGEVFTVAARVARHLSKYDEASALLDRARDLGAEEHLVQVERALLRAQMGDLPQVERFLERMADPKAPFQLEIVSTLTPLYYSTFDLNKANVISKLWIEADPSNPEAYQWRGLILDRVGARLEADQALKKSVELDPGRVDVHIYLASRHLRYSDPKAALESIEKAEKIKPDHIDLPLLKARALSETGKEDEARTMLEKHVVNDPDPAIYRELGGIELKSGLYEKALEHLEIALKAYPMDQGVLFKIAQAQDQLGKKEAAANSRVRMKQVEADLDLLKGITKTVMDQPNDPAPRIQAAKIMEKNGVGIEACRWALSALRLSPGNPDAMKVLENNREAATKANHFRSILEFLR